MDSIFESLVLFSVKVTILVKISLFVLDCVLSKVGVALRFWNEVVYSSKLELVVSTIGSFVVDDVDS